MNEMRSTCNSLQQDNQRLALCAGDESVARAKAETLVNELNIIVCDLRDDVARLRTRTTGECQVYIKLLLDFDSIPSNI